MDTAFGERTSFRGHVAMLVREFGGLSDARPCLNL
jgi:hypothetical protein